MSKRTIGAQLSEADFREFTLRAKSFPKQQSGLVRTALKFYFENHPFSPPKEEAERAEEIIQDEPIHQ